VPQIAEKCSAEIVGTIGNIIILYKENADPEKRKIKV